MRHHSRSLRAAVAGTALVLAACSTGSPTDAPEPTTGTTEPASPTDSPAPIDTGAATSPTPTGTTEDPTPTDRGTVAAGVPDLSARCTAEPDADSGLAIEQVEYAVPEGWQVDGSCEFLDPALDELASETQPDTALGIRVEPVDFATAAAGDELDRVRRWIGARSGHQAVRLAGESSGEGLRPAGEPTVRWLVDLDPGSDDAGGTLVLSAHPSGGADLALAAEAVDRIAQTVRVVPAADPDAVVVTRVEGGGQPWTVTHGPDDGCLRLRAGGPDDEVQDEACDVSAPDDGPSGAVLTDGDVRVVAGLAPATAVRVETDADATLAGSVTTAVEGASLDAHPAPQAPVEVTAVDAAGTPIGSTTVE